jgi:hypothetical protein
VFKRVGDGERSQLGDRVCRGGQLSVQAEHRGVVPASPGCDTIRASRWAV